MEKKKINWKNPEERKAWFKKYQQSDAYKKSQQKYRQSDAYKKSQQKYLQKYQQSDEFKKSEQAKRRINYLLNHYQNTLENTKKELGRYQIPPIPLQGKAIMEKEIIDNLMIIKEHTSNLNSKLKPDAINAMIDKLLSQEGILVSRRKKLIFRPIHSPSLKAEVSLGADL